MISPSFNSCVLVVKALKLSNLIPLGLFLSYFTLRNIDGNSNLIAFWSSFFLIVMEILVVVQCNNFFEKKFGCQSEFLIWCLIFGFLKIRDKLELKAANDGSASYAALERKAELYEKLVKGELSDEEDNEKYCVDFFRKGLVQDESKQPQGHGSIPPADEVVEDDVSVLFNVKSMGPGRNAGIVDNNEHKRFVREVHVEASRAREKASEVKLRREEQATARREKLKQAYMRKKLEKLKAASSAEQT